jgi:hypothetical protein
MIVVVAVPIAIGMQIVTFYKSRFYNLCSTHGLGDCGSRVKGRVADPSSIKKFPFTE